jgi:DsbC/DsbD-like thiol-disulfide interchange protein
MNYGYEHEVVLPFELKIPATAKPGDQLQLHANAQWLICSDVCVPDGADLTLTLPIEAVRRVDERSSALIAGAIGQSPKPAIGAMAVKRTSTGFQLGVADPDLAASAKAATSIRFFPDGEELNNGAKISPAEPGR